MKLIRCYIENFGGLHQYSLDFSEGITVIEAPNGFGKTTLAEFLRAMLYGFPRKAKTLDKSRRQKYTPWGGGTFGGYLEFEQDGVCYRLERTFGATPKGDTFSLIDLATGKKSGRFTENIGLELFQLDADSFERSTYLPQNYDNSPLTTAGIQTKLADLVEDTGDINRFDKAQDALRTRRSRYIPYRGGGGTVAEASARISGIQSKVDATRALETVLESCDLEIAETERTISDSRREMGSLRQQWEAASRSAHLRQQYAETEEALQKTDELIETLEAAYPAGIPGDGELETAQQWAAELAALEGRAPDADAGAEALLKQERSRFGNRIPTDGELEQARQNCQTIASLNARAEGLALTAAENAKLEELSRKFSGGVPEETELDALADENRKLLRQRVARDAMAEPHEDRIRREELEEKVIPDPEALARQLESAEKTKKSPLPILGAVLLALGMALAVLKLLLPGIVLAAVGALLILLGRKKNGPDPKVQQLQAELEAARRDRETLERLREKLRALERDRSKLSAVIDALEENLAAALGTAADFDRAISDLRLAREQYLDLRVRADHLKNQRFRLDAQAEAAYGELAAFLAVYGLKPGGDPAATVAKLQRDRDAYLLAKERMVQWEAAMAAYHEQLHRREENLDDLFRGYGLVRSDKPMRQLQQLRDRGKAWAAAREERKILAEKLDAMEKPTGADPQQLKAAEEALAIRCDSLTEKLLEMRRKRTDLQTELDGIPELTDELERLQQQKNADQNRARLLDDTMELLRQARENLTTGYLGPIRRGFAGYMSRLSQVGEQAFVSPELEIRLERQGKARELGYFSAGQTDLVMLGMRLALVDALFREEKPFVILDDPFVNLDDAHTAQALTLLEDLGRERQIIYLTCSTSRKP